MASSSGGSDGAKTAGIIVGVILAVIVFVAIIGILAAIAIPNFVKMAERSPGLQRARQKKTVAELRLLGTSLESYATDENKYPDPNNLEAALVPKYMRALPMQDGWEQPLRYECWPAGECSEYAIASSGADKTFEHEALKDYGPDTKTSAYDNDIVFANGQFVQYPEGDQR